MPNEIEREFESRGLVRGGLLLMSAEVAIELIARYRERLIPILGIDGFVVGPDSTQPDMADDIDFSTMDAHVDSWRFSEMYLQSRIGNDRLYEIIVDKQS